MVGSQVQAAAGGHAQEHRGRTPGQALVAARDRTNLGRGELHQRQHQAAGESGQDMG